MDALCIVEYEEEHCPSNASRIQIWPLMGTDKLTIDTTLHGMVPSNVTQALSLLAIL